MYYDTGIGIYMIKYRCINNMCVSRRDRICNCCENMLVKELIDGLVNLLICIIDLYIVLYCVILYYIMLRNVISYYNIYIYIFFHVLLYHIMPYYITLCYVILHYRWTEKWWCESNVIGMNPYVSGFRNTNTRNQNNHEE